MSATNARRLDCPRTLWLALMSTVDRQRQMWVEEEGEGGDGDEVMDIPRIVPAVVNDDKDEEAEGGQQ